VEGDLGEWVWRRFRRKGLEGKDLGKQLYMFLLNEIIIV
jgi:hypothetical protein